MNLEEKDGRVMAVPETHQLEGVETLEGIEPKPKVRRRRWWIPVLMLLLLGGAFAIWYATRTRRGRNR